MRTHKTMKVESLSSRDSLNSRENNKDIPLFGEYRDLVQDSLTTDGLCDYLCGGIR